ncbi:chemotaxis protein CheW [Zavarzinia sp. CC-PAN008]|uniref:chemotaxis protein CheW n=1 Tax=Zavarzinia sp. CC-PAN008 TaxID=3243332 RepID=UPI003F744B58
MAQDIGIAAATPEPAPVQAARPDDGPLLALLFRLGELRLGLPVGSVETVVPAPRPAALPQAPAVVAGLVDVHGAVLPCLDLRRRVDGAATAIGAETRLILARTVARRVAILADSVQGVEVLPARGAMALVPLAPGAGLLRAAAIPGDGIVLLHDVEALLSAAEETQLAAALAALANHTAEP